MNIKDYENEAIATMAKNTKKDSLIINTMGLVGEAGEFSEKIKHKLFHKWDVKPEELYEELGDVIWYVTALAHVLGTSLEELMKQNVLKLRERYPKGFSCEKSINRREHSTDGKKED